MQKLSLTNKYLPYPKYKDSEVEWVGQAPTSWDSTRAKNIFVKNTRPVRSEDEIVTAFRDGTVTLRKNRRADGFTFAEQEIGYQGVRKNDLVIHGMDAFAGAIGVSDSDGKSSPVYAVCTPRSYADPKFHMYLLRHMSRSGYLTAIARGIRERSTEFKWNQYGNMLVVNPPKEEQEKIVRFLDEQTIRIDETIAKKHNLIELLKEKRTAVINHAVTKGLDPKAELVESKIDWIGMIPKSWSLEKLKYLAPLVTQKTNIENATSNYIALENAEGKTGRHLPSSEPINPDSMVTVFGKSDVLFSKLRPYLAKVLAPGFDGFATGEFLVLRPKKNMSQKYIKYRLLSQDFITIVNDSTYGAQMPRASWNFIGSQFVTLPPKEDQEKIAAYLDNVVDKYQHTISEEQKSVTLLQELKSSLISHAVTGKIKV